MDNFNGQNPVDTNQYQQPVQQVPYQQPVPQPVPQPAQQVPVPQPAPQPVPQPAQQVPVQQPVQQMQYQQPAQQPVQQMSYQQPAQQPVQQMSYQQPVQQPAQQVPYQQPAQQMQYQQPVYQNAAYVQPKKKSGAMKWLLIAGIPTLLAVFALSIFLIIWLVFPSYDIDDYEDVYDACYEVFDVKMAKESRGTISSDGIVDSAYGSHYESDYEASIYWYEYADEELAEDKYSDFVKNYNDQYDEIKEYSYYKEYDFETDDKLTQFYYGSDKNGSKIVVILEDEYVMKIYLNGDAKIIERLAEEFIDEMD